MQGLSQYSQDSFYFNLRLSPLLSYKFQDKTFEYMEVFNGHGRLTLKVKSNNFAFEENNRYNSSAKAPYLVKLTVEEGSPFHVVKKVLESGIGSKVCVWYEGKAYLNCSKAIIDTLKLLSGDNVEIIFSLHLERIAMTNGLPRCRFVIENVERELPEATLSPQPPKKRSRKNTPKKTPDLPDFGDLETFLASIDSQTCEPSGQATVV